MADFLAGWLAGGQTRDRNFAAEDEISNAIIKANYARQQEERAAQERIARARNLSPMAQQGNQAAQMELAAMGLGETPQQLQARQERQKVEQARFDIEIGMKREGMEASDAERQAAQERWNKEMGFRQGQAQERKAERGEDISRADVIRAEDISRRAAERAQDIARAEGRQATQDDFERARLQLSQEAFKWQQGAEDRASKARMEEATRIGRSVAGLPDAPVAKAPELAAEDPLWKTLHDTKNADYDAEYEAGRAALPALEEPKRPLTYKEVKALPYDKALPYVKALPSEDRFRIIAERGSERAGGAAWPSVLRRMGSVASQGLDWLIGGSETASPKSAKPAPAQKAQTKQDKAAQELQAKEELARKAAELALSGMTRQQIQRELAPPDVSDIALTMIDDYNELALSSTDKREALEKQAVYRKQLRARAKNDPHAKQAYRKIMGE